MVAELVVDAVARAAAGVEGLMESTVEGETGVEERALEDGDSGDCGSAGDKLSRADDRASSASDEAVLLLLVWSAAAEEEGVVAAAAGDGDGRRTGTVIGGAVAVEVAWKGACVSSEVVFVASMRHRGERATACR